jgi:EmrB/QacA subfamily drug resistance transporter
VAPGTEYDQREFEPARGSEAAGGAETPFIAWTELFRRQPELIRERIEQRARKHGRFHWWVLWTVLGGFFSVNVSFTIFAVALPRLARELDTTINVMTWTITGPLLAFGVVAPALGRLGDVWGHRRLFLFALCGEILTTALSALAPNVGVLIAARVAGAILGAAIGSSGMAMILTEFHADERVKAMGYWSLVGAGGPVLGVALGGPLIEAFGWRALFWAQLPAIVLAVLVTGAILPGQPDDGPVDREPGSPRRSLDLAGAATIAIAALAFLLALNRGVVMGLTHPLVLLAIVLVPIGTAGFVAAERRSSDPLLPLEFLKRRNFTAPVMAQVFGNFTHMGGFILLPAMLDRVFGYGEARIGLLTISRPLAFSLAAPAAGYLALRVGERRVAVFGCLSIVISMLMLATTRRSSPDWWIMAALAFGGGGLGGASPMFAATIANAMGESRLGVASAAQQLTQNIGVVSGIQIMTTVQILREPAAGVIGSYSNGFLVGATSAALAAGFAFTMRSRARGLANVPAPADAVARPGRQSGQPENQAGQPDNKE